MHWVLKKLLRPFTYIVPKGFPISKLIPLLLLQICESFTNNSITTYASFLVLDFGVVDNKDEAGYYSGLLNSCFFLSQFISSFFLGVLSDNIGRKPVMLLGSIGSAISTLLFGFSFNFPWAVVTRSINGLVNGNIGVIKTLMGELSTKENRSEVFGLIGLTNGVGIVIGAMIGGFLARPSIQYPSIFGDIKFFQTFPYLLPNLVCSIITVIGVILAIIYLQETQHHEKKENIFEEVKVVLKDVVARTVQMVKFLFSKEYAGIVGAAMYAVIGMGSGMILTCIPLFVMASYSVGGLEFETDQIGILNIASAFGVIVAQLFIFKPTVRFFKLLWTNRIGSILNIIIYASVPLVGYLQPLGDVAMWIGILSISFALQIPNQYCFSSVMAIIANSVESNTLGALNGLAQSLVSILRFFAPLAASPLVAWSFTNKFPFNVHFAFVIVALVPFTNFLLSLLLPKSINEPKQVNDDIQFSPLEDSDQTKTPSPITLDIATSTEPTAIVMDDEIELDGDPIEL
ncbi:Transporter [Entamoeba marina]